MINFLLNGFQRRLNIRKTDNFDFIAFDVETANKDLSSICQIGFAFVSNGQVGKTWGVYINPETDDFSNEVFHGISNKTVRSAKIFPEVINEIRPQVERNILVHHSSNHFDKKALENACERYQLPNLDVVFKNSYFFAKQNDILGPQASYALNALCDKHSIIRKKEHDAIQDAIDLANLVLCIQRQYGLSISDWVQTRKPKSTPDEWRSIKQDATNAGPLSGLEFVLTGNFQVKKQELSDLIAEHGGNVRDRVTKSTSYLVVGNPSPFQKESLSTKHKTAIELLKQGFSIEIITETDLYSKFI